MQTPTDSEIEQRIDRRVQARLTVDPAYRFAESAEDQSRREREVTAEVEADVRRASRWAESHPSFFVTEEV